jgi:ketosteroid isomerase-like protein
MKSTILPVLLVLLALPCPPAHCAEPADDSAKGNVAKANEALIRKYVAAGKAQDTDTLRTILADDVVMHFHGRNALAGANKGREATWTKLGEVWGPLKLEFKILKIQDLLVNDNRAVLLMKVRISSPDGIVESNRVDVYRIVDGKIVELWVYDDDQYAVDALFWPKKPIASQSDAQ